MKRVALSVGHIQRLHALSNKNIWSHRRLDKQSLAVAAVVSVGGTTWNALPFVLRTVVYSLFPRLALTGVLWPVTTCFLFQLSQSSPSKVVWRSMVATAGFKIFSAVQNLQCALSCKSCRSQIGALLPLLIVKLAWNPTARYFSRRHVGVVFQCSWYK